MLAARLTALSAAATAAAAITAGPVLADPARPPADSASAARSVDRLFAEAERAVDAYNGTVERVADLETELERVRDRVARGQQAVNDLRRVLGAAAAAHYRVGGIDPTLTLMLSDDPDSYLERVGAFRRASDRRTGELRDLLAAQRTLDGQRAEAGDRLAELTAEKDELERRKQAVQRRLAEARAEYERLTDEERAARAAERAERAERASRSAREERDAPAPAAAAQEPPQAPAASGRAGTAVAAAVSAVGLPYGWGQAGPSAFDCSGLVQWAWARAGVSLPRTSQAQAGAGSRVPLSAAQPGDIVVYRADASHVALYVGGGQVVHAPYPGASVRYDPVGMMDVSGVVRP
ncbi:NlpC/P60 family protein [Streptomyces avicenniae]|uniref:C40 family peptidase n=1 Tax=Streptomyces avicenniae TaxID=500153 RepID=UPI000DA62701|nr:C40 family peptidase [Streptomyces avicenniae]